MPAWRLALFSFLGFSVPLLLAVVFLPIFFGELRSSPEIQIEAVTSSELSADDSVTDIVAVSQLAAVSSNPPQKKLNSYRGFVALPESVGVDPSFKELSAKSDSQFFLVSLDISFSDSTNLQGRNRLFLKYENSRRPYSGWGVSLSGSELSLRPEVYWQDAKGKGGWYSFADLELRRSGRLKLTLLATANSLSLLAQTADEGQSNFDSPRFIGGHVLEQQSVPSSKRPISIAEKLYESSSDGGLRLHQLRIATLSELDRPIHELSDLEKDLWVRSKPVFSFVPVKEAQEVAQNLKLAQRKDKLSWLH